MGEYEKRMNIDWMNIEEFVHVCVCFIQAKIRTKDKLVNLFPIPSHLVRYAILDNVL